MERAELPNVGPHGEDAPDASGLDVFLVPVGAERYELYCEVEDRQETADLTPKGFFGPLVQRFRAMLAYAERVRRQGTTEPAARGVMQRVSDRLLGWMAEAIAEQRLLWNLRRQDHATLVYPDDLSEPHAMAIVRESFRRDADRHRFWLIVDAALFALSGVLALVPGPNLIAYYFAFRVVGHYLSYHGARRGLDTVHWHARPSAPLTELRGAIALAPDVRALRIHELAMHLRLQHLAAFVQRTAAPGA